MTPTEEVVSRYARVERQADALGRLIGVRKLKVSQQTKVAEWTPGLEGMSEVVLPEGNVVSISRRAQMLVAAAVCEMEGNPIPFARSRGELDSIADRLDEEGLIAAMIAYARFAPQKAEGGAEESVLDQAKK